MTAFNPLKTPVDVVKLGRRGAALQTTPGLARIFDADQEIVWDQQQGYGAAGAFLIGRGNKLVPFSLELRLFTDAHWLAYDVFRPLVQRPPFGKRAAPLDISHPWLVMQNIKQCVVTKCKMPTLSDDMLGIVVINFLEYRVPHLALSKPEAEAKEPLDWWDQQIKDRRETIEGQNQLLAK